MLHLCTGKQHTKVCLTARQNGDCLKPVKDDHSNCVLSNTIQCSQFFVSKERCDKKKKMVSLFFPMRELLANKYWPQYLITQHAWFIRNNDFLPFIHFHPPSAPQWLLFQPDGEVVWKARRPLQHTGYTAEISTARYTLASLQRIFHTATRLFGEINTLLPLGTKHTQSTQQLNISGNGQQECVQ